MFEFEFVFLCALILVTLYCIVRSLSEMKIPRREKLPWTFIFIFLAFSDFVSYMGYRLNLVGQFTVPKESNFLLGCYFIVILICAAMFIFWALPRLILSLLKKDRRGVEPKIGWLCSFGRCKFFTNYYPFKGAVYGEAIRWLGLDNFVDGSETWSTEIGVRPNEGYGLFVEATVEADESVSMQDFYKENDRLYQEFVNGLGKFYMNDPTLEQVHADLDPIKTAVPGVNMQRKITLNVANHF